MSFPSASAATISPSELNNCQLCSEPDSHDHMVQCDKCDLWFHYQCAQVNSSVETEDWSCKTCSDQASLSAKGQMPRRRSSASSKRSKSSKTSSIRRRQLELRMLEEERTMQEKRDQEYLKRKHQILSQSIEESSDSDGDSETDSQAQVKNWLKDGQYRKVSTGSQLTFTGIHKSAVTELSVPQVSKPIINSSWMGAVVGESQPQKQQQEQTQRVEPNENYAHSDVLNIMPPNPGTVTSANLSRPFNTFHEPPQDNMNLQFPSIENSRLEQHQSSRHVRRSPVAPHQPNQGYARAMTHSSLTRDNIAARQSIARELPSFGGNPAEWPLFISNFSRSTEICGFTEDENLVRLQKALKGDAMEAVRSMLIQPRCVPKIISTLKMLFGRPELTVFTLLEKIRATIPPKTEKLETIVAFAIAVQNMCATIEAAGLQSHLSNPTLIQELVEKLPPSIRLNWAIYNQTLRVCTLSEFSNWLYRVAEAANDVIIPKISPMENKQTSRGSKEKGFLNAHSEDAAQTNNFNKREKGLCLVCGGSCISVDKCQRFQQLSHSLKWEERRIAPVVLYGNNSTIKAFAFIDEGSSLTLIAESLANELNIEGTPKPVILGWTAGMTREENESKLLSVRISGTGVNAKKYQLRNAHTVKGLQLPMQSLDVDNLQGKFKHLRYLPIESYANISPRLLIGLNNWKLGLTIKYREGKAHEQVASKTRLGWTVYGCYSHSSAQNVGTHANLHISEYHPDRDLELQNLVQQYVFNENFYVSNSKDVLLPQEEQRSLDLLKQMTHRKDGRFVTGLLWKYNEIQLPDSFQMAKGRSDSLQKRMNRDPVLAEAFHKKIDEYVLKGYARKLSTEDLKEKRPVWYLPIFPVQNPNKPGKLRIVWDAAAKVNGISLNSMLLKGPDQLVSLTSVIFRFRQHRIAICADIMEMYHQILMREDDQHFQRFLWRGRNQKELDCFVMKVMTFGATCSPACAQYVKNLNAKEFEKQYPKAAKSICENHYVDDLMDSVDSEAEAIDLANAIRFIHQQGGFLIRNWISNSRVVINALQSSPTKEITFNAKSEPETEKVLGMWWCTSSDYLTFRLSSNTRHKDLLLGKRRPSKREVLRILMTIFDPLGFLANFLMYLKVLLQEIWRTCIAWDEEVQDAQFDKWLNWIRFLPQVNNLKIPRCYVSNKMTHQPRRQLHVFVDASENGFAAAAYIRSSDGKVVECTLVAAKTRVAPLKILSIPRLELSAAVLGARLAKIIIDSHTVNFEKIFLWSDSRIVLGWLHSDHRRYRQYVAFRVTEILELTNLSDWRWIPSELNVADEATKWTKNPEFCAANRWIKGPPFLLLPSEEWPSQENRKINTSVSEELKSQFVGVHGSHHTKVFSPERFSNWNRLLRCAAFTLRFAHNARSVHTRAARRSGVFTQDELREAENALFREAQYEKFAEDTNALLLKGTVSKSSSLASLCPYIDDQGVIRSNDRVAAAGIFGQNRKIILPKEHPTTKLLVQKYHRQYHHRNHETVVNELRQRFIIPKLRVVLQAIRKSCQDCKNSSALPKAPLMSQLPPARLAVFSRPFSFVGVDYFGPMYVSHLRRTEKRWGVLLTCLTTRAIHIEIAYTMSTDSCILALRNFIARRGNPLEFFSDNGTNFQGAERELKEAYTTVDSIKLMETFTTSNTKWTFNPAASPHMGGSWERLVRSIKSVLYKIMPTRNPSDELLRGMLMEVENVINSRPLTYIPLRDENDEALTPNHFLLGSSSGSKPIAVFDDNTVSLRKNWLTAQLYADLFWRRWVNEYLPTITRRTKWFSAVKPIEVGDIVYIVDPKNPRNCWPKGRIIKTQTSKDGQVRSASVLTPTGIYERPAVKLAVLDIRDIRDPVMVGPGEDIPGGSVNIPDEKFGSKAASVKSHEQKP